MQHPGEQYRLLPVHVPVLPPSRMMLLRNAARGHLDPYFSEVRIIREGRGAPAGMNPPGQHMADAWSSAEFWANKLLVEHRNSDGCVSSSAGERTRSMLVNRRTVTSFGILTAFICCWVLAFAALWRPPSLEKPLEAHKLPGSLCSGSKTTRCRRSKRLAHWHSVPYRGFVQTGTQRSTASSDD